MATQVINISLPSKLLLLVDRVADKEARTRSELFREAIRSYVLRRIRWEELFAYGAKQAKKLRIKREDIEKIIAEYRAGKK